MRCDAITSRTAYQCSVSWRRTENGAQDAVHMQLRCDLLHRLKDTYSMGKDKHRVSSQVKRVEHHWRWTYVDFD